jgi:hypothetical protein
MLYRLGKSASQKIGPNRQKSAQIAQNRPKSEKLEISEFFNIFFVG